MTRDKPLMQSDVGPGSVAMVRHQAFQSYGATWQFRFLHIAGVAVTLPVVALSRLWPGHRREHRDESVFVETNRTVLTALGFAFMA